MKHQPPTHVRFRPSQFWTGANGNHRRIKIAAAETNLIATRCERRNRLSWDGIRFEAADPGLAEGGAAYQKSGGESGLHRGFIRGTAEKSRWKFPTAVSTLKNKLCLSARKLSLSCVVMPAFPLPPQRGGESLTRDGRQCNSLCRRGEWGGGRRFPWAGTGGSYRRWRS